MPSNLSYIKNQLNMKKIVSFFLIAFCISFAMAQTGNPEIHFSWNKTEYPIYQHQINKLVFLLKACPSAHQSVIEQDIKSVNFVENTIVTSKSNNEVSYEITLTKNISIEELKLFFESIHFTQFFFNGKKVYVSDLITMEEVFAKKSQSENETISVSLNTNITPEEQKAFDIQNAKIKLNSLYNLEYPRYLFNGSVSDMKDRVISALEK